MKPLLCFLESEFPIFKYLRKESSSLEAKRLADCYMPLADVFAFANFSAHIMSSNPTSCSAAIDLQMSTNRRRYAVDNIN